MTWYYLATVDASEVSACAPVLEHSTSPWRLGFGPSRIVSTTHPPEPYSWHVWEMVGSTVERSGTTFVPFEGKNYLPSTSFQRASPAKTSVLQELARAWTDSEVAYTTMSSGSSKKHARRSSSSKTSLGSESTSRESGQISEPSVTQFAPDYCPRLLSERPIDGTEFSCLLPTLTASSYGSNRGGAAGRGATQKPRYSIQYLIRNGMLPTLTAKGNYNKAGLSERSGDGICTTTMQTTGKRLTTQFACWMMGLPLDWLDSDSSVTASSGSKPAPRSKRSQASNNNITEEAAE